MKKIVFILILLIPFISLNAQDNSKKSRKQLKNEQQAKEREALKKMLKNKDFVFSPTMAIPMNGASIQLNYSYSTHITGDTINSYLPYYGVAYSVKYGNRTSPFDFTKPIKNYTTEKDKKGYVVKFDVQNGMDHLKFSFHISENGYTNLNVISTNRQSISFYGRIEKPQVESTNLD